MTGPICPSCGGRHDTSADCPGPVIVICGEGGPEPVRLPPGARIVNGGGRCGDR